MPVLVEHLAKHSPGITIESVPLGEHAIQTLLNDAKIDLAIAHVSEDTGRLRREMLYCEQFVCCFHPSQLAYATPIASEDYFSSVHGLVSDSENLPGFLEHLLRHAPMQLEAPTCRTTASPCLRWLLAPHSSLPCKPVSPDATPRHLASLLATCHSRLTNCKST